MKAIILSAGQGKRLIPLTENMPKCLLSLMPGTTLLSWQLAQLAAAEIEDVVVVTGFGVDAVETEITRCRSFINARALFNPDYATTDNLKSAWSARNEMNEDFILLNGDTLFDGSILETLLNTPRQPVTVGISKKDHYDADDMKVGLCDGYLERIGKTIGPDNVDAESIGMILFRDKGVADFRQAVEATLATKAGERLWFLSAIEHLTKSMTIHVARVSANHWCEVDFPVDLQRARSLVARWALGMSEPESVAARAS